MNVTAAPPADMAGFINTTVAQPDDHTGVLPLPAIASAAVPSPKAKGGGGGRAKAPQQQVTTYDQQTAPSPKHVGRALAQLHGKADAPREVPIDAAEAESIMEDHAKQRRQTIFHIHRYKTEFKEVVEPIVKGKDLEKQPLGKLKEILYECKYAVRANNMGELDTSMAEIGVAAIERVGTDMLGLQLQGLTACTRDPRFQSLAKEAALEHGIVVDVDPLWRMAAYLMSMGRTIHQNNSLISAQLNARKEIMAAPILGNNNDAGPPSKSNLDVEEEESTAGPPKTAPITTFQYPPPISPAVRGVPAPVLEKETEARN